MTPIGRIGPNCRADGFDLLALTIRARLQDGDQVVILRKDGTVYCEPATEADTLVRRDPTPLVGVYTAQASRRQIAADLRAARDAA